MWHLGVGGQKDITGISALLIRRDFQKGGRERHTLYVSVPAAPVWPGLGIEASSYH